MRRYRRARAPRSDLATRNHGKESVTPKERSPGPGGLLALAVLVVAALAVYGGSLRNPLVFDDLVLGDPETLRAYAEVFRPRLRWLSQLSFGWMHVVAGAGWFWQRLLSVLLHAATAAALFGFLARLFAEVLEDENARWFAFYAAALFLLHPVSVYGAAYLIERSIVMATLFSLLSLRCVLEGWLRRSMRWFLAAAAAYVLAVLSKEHAVALPGVAAALVLLVRRKAGAGLRWLAAPAAVFALIGVIVVYQGRALIGAPYEPYAAPAIGALPGFNAGFDQRLAYPISVINQGWLFFRYLLAWLVPWPGWMSIDLRMPVPGALLAWPQTAGFVAWLAYAACAVLLLTRGGRAGFAGFGLLAPWLLALTEVAVARLQEPFVLYRSYLWMPLLFAALPAVLWRVPQRWRHALVAAACLALAAGTVDRLGTFKSGFALWDDVVKKNGDSRVALVERGYLNRGQVRYALGEREEALADFERALALNERFPDAWLARASVHLVSGRAAQALADADRAVALDPQYASAWDKRCVALLALGRAAEARTDCERALALNPRNVDALVDAGAAYYRLGQNDAAEKSYRRALAINPQHGVGNHNLGMLLLDAGRRDETVRNHFVTACNAGVKASCDLLRRSRRE